MTKPIGWVPQQLLNGIDTDQYPYTGQYSGYADLARQMGGAVNYAGPSPAEILANQESRRGMSTNDQQANRPPDPTDPAILASPYWQAYADDRSANDYTFGEGGRNRNLALGLAFTGLGASSLLAAPAVAAGGGAAGATAATSTAAAIAPVAAAGGAIMSNLPAIISGAASLIGGRMASNAAGDAVDAQVAAGDRALDFQRESRDMALDLSRPQLQASQVAMARMLSMTGQPIPAALQEALTAAGVTDIGEFDIEDDPGYQFRRDESMRALETGAFARGGGMSGGFANAALRYAQDYASTEYSNIYGRLATIGGYGPVAANSSSNAALNFGANAANTAMETGDARASGYVAQSNAWQNALDQIAQLPWDQWLPQRQQQTAPARNGSWG